MSSFPPLSRDRNWSRQTHRQKLISEGKNSQVWQRNIISRSGREEKCNKGISRILPPSLFEHTFQKNTCSSYTVKRAGHACIHETLQSGPQLWVCRDISTQPQHVLHFYISHRPKEDIPEQITQFWVNASYLGWSQLRHKCHKLFSGFHSFPSAGLSLKNLA